MQFFFPTLVIYFVRVKADSRYLPFTITVGLINPFSRHHLLSFDACLILFSLLLVVFDYSVYHI